MPAQLNTPLVINRKTLRNRIVMPAMVCFNWADDEGKETVSRAEHYGRRAKGGAALIVTEATAVTKAGRLHATELGLWSNDQVPQFARIADACRKAGTLTLVQLVHAGSKAVASERFSASASVVTTPDGEKHIHALSLDQIQQIKADFVRAAVRAKQAGVDGVEIHGAHGYLLNQFASAASNNRGDLYGAGLDGRLRLSLEITREIRVAVGPDFLLSYRLGVNDPSLDEDAYFAGKLAEAGIDLLDVSAGIGGDGIRVPAGFPFEAITWMGCGLRKRVKLPVACVYGIMRPEQAAFLMNNDHTDLVAIGRGQLADAEWANKAIAGRPVNECLRCKPGCKYRDDGRTCPVDGARR